MRLETPVKDWQFLKPVGRWTIPLAITAALATSGVGVYRVYQQTKTQPTVEVPVVTAPEIKAVTALGRLEPQGEVIKVSAPSSIEGTRLAKLLVKEGDQLKTGQNLAILDSYDRLSAALEQAKKEVQVAQANLAKVKAGAKAGELAAQRAEIARLQAQLQGEIATQQATVARWQEQLIGDKRTQQATIARLQAQLAGERRTQQAAIARLQAQLGNAQVEFKRYQTLFSQGAVEASKFDSKRLEWETATQQLNEARSSLLQAEAMLIQQINEAQANLSRTEATLAQQINEAKANRNKTIDTLQEQIQQAKATLNQIAEVRPTDVEASQAEIERAKAAVKKAQADLEQAFVKSPVDGQILKIHTRPGEVVGSNGIAEVGQTNQMFAIAEVYESDIAKVRLNQEVTVNSETNAFSGELKGKVEQIGLQIGKKDILNTDPAADVDARVVEVKIRLDPESSKQVSGLTYSKVVVKIYTDSPIPSASNQ